MELNNFQNQMAVWVKSAYKKYGAQTNAVSVLEGVNMEVPKGAIYGLLGSSGCGKTTLLNCIIGLKKLNSGDIWILGNTPSQKCASKIGYMPQHISLSFELTIRESMRFFGWLAGLSAIQINERLEFISKLLMLPDVDTKIKCLSGGQQRRVSFATALLHEPELLILDEPTVGLDPLLRETIWKYLLSLTDSKLVTIILTTHYIDEARQADKIGLMRNGQIICEESPTNLLVKFNTNSLEEAFYKTIITKNQNVADDKCPPFPQLEKRTAVKKPLIRYHNFLALIWKNFKWMSRNYLFMVTVFLLPIMTVFVFATAIGGEPKNLKVGVVNYEKEFNGDCGGILMCNSSHLSCHFLNYLDNFNLVILGDEEEARLSVIKGNTYASIIFKSNYTESLKDRIESVLHLPNTKFEASTVEVIYDTTIKDIAYFTKAYLFKRFKKFVEDYFETCEIPKEAAALPVHFLTPVHGVAEPKYIDFACPGVLLTMAFFLSTALTSGITLIERAEGILERSLVMGVNMFEIITAHIVSQFGIMVLQCICPLMVLFLFFDITLKGSMLLVICFTLTTGFCGMCAGFSVSSWCADERTAAFCLLGTFLPTIIVSGILWPLEAMNDYLKWFTYFLPLTIPVQSLRHVLQKGWNFDQSSVSIGLIIVNLWTVFFLVISFVGLKRRKS